MKRAAATSKARKNAQLIADKLHEIAAALDTLTVDDLQAIDDDLASLSETNCGWWSYEMRRPMRHIVGYVLTQKHKKLRRVAEYYGIRFVS